LGALIAILGQRYGPGLFGVPGAQSDPEEEERRRIVALFAAALTAVSIRVFTRAALR